MIRSAVNCDVLPLVEFLIDPSIHLDEAERLLKAEPLVSAGGAALDDVDHIDLNASMNENADDTFQQQLLQVDVGADGKIPPIVIDSRGLRAMKPEEVMIQRTPSGPRFFRNVIPEIDVITCPHCQLFFREEDYSFASLNHGRCPACRTPNVASSDLSALVDEPVM